MSIREGTARKPVKAEPKRIRVNVPVADESVLAWFDLQENHSVSVRQLIRESIERHGYVDVVNRPVAQLPKRGRPAVGPGEDIAGRSGASDVPPSAGSSPAVPGMPAADGEFLDLSAEADAGPELLGIALQAPALAGTAAPLPDTGLGSAAVPPEPAHVPAPTGQVDVNDLMSALR